MTLNEISTMTPRRKRKMNISGPSEMAHITKSDTKNAMPIHKIIDAICKP
jgi:hypothetical protein